MLRQKTKHFIVTPLLTQRRLPWSKGIKGEARCTQRASSRSRRHPTGLLLSSGEGWADRPVSEC
eukprot:611629-Alexandrium_andersonii.AAC.1